MRSRFSPWLVESRLDRRATLPTAPAGMATMRHQLTGLCKAVWHAIDLQKWPDSSWINHKKLGSIARCARTHITYTNFICIGSMYANFIYLLDIYLLAVYPLCVVPRVCVSMKALLNTSTYILLIKMYSFYLPIYLTSCLRMRQLDNQRIRVRVLESWRIGIRESGSHVVRAGFSFAQLR